MADSFLDSDAGTLNITSVLGQSGGSFGFTKNGTGKVTLNGSAVNTFTGGLTLNCGILLADFANLSTPTNLLGSGNALTLGGGTLTVQGKNSGTTAQTLGNVNGGTSTTITLGSLTTTAAGGSLLVGTAGANTTGLSITTTTNKDTQGIYGGRVVFFNGTADTGYDWATTASGSTPYTLSAYSGYTPLPTTARQPGKCRHYRQPGGGPLRALLSSENDF